MRDPKRPREVSKDLTRWVQIPGTKKNVDLTGGVRIPGEGVPESAFIYYFKGRSQVTKVGNTFSDPAYIKGGVPQGSKIGPLAFIVHINDLPSVVQSSDDNSDTVSMFMDDTTMSEVLNVSDHISGESIGNSQCNLESVLRKYYERRKYATES